MKILTQILKKFNAIFFIVILNNFQVNVFTGSRVFDQQSFRFLKYPQKSLGDFFAVVGYQVIL